MPSIARSILLAVYASFFLALTGFSPATSSALASPLPDTNSPRSLLAVRIVTKHTDTELIARIPTAISPVVASPATSLHPRQSFESISGPAAKTRKAADHMSALAQRSRTENDEAFQQACADGLTEYYGSFQAFQKGFNELVTTDKGLSNLNKGDQLEELIKTVVNANKDALTAVTVIVDNVPIVGPILAPIVAELKCLVDLILDATENILDATLNVLVVILHQLLDPFGLGGLVVLLQGLALL
ncbi:hypothetical protein FB45DRAFT_917049 [Roridomyces roridus]|uniref:Uncharacterized protein n=1 Tax=Roridomyces roridus TaxID=1738132 RepID=A0AAD7BUH2_9AGAR|nr:hypothetical protein FB45DRAFT_917049 [Roridomyces roridus]